MLVAATALGACTGSDGPADQTRSTTTTARLSSADRAELRAEMEWLLSPTPPCPPPPRLDGPPAAESVDAMLQLLGLEPTPAPRCLEGDQQP